MRHSVPTILCRGMLVRNILKEIEIHLVENADEVLKLALELPKPEEFLKDRKGLELPIFETSTAPAAATEAPKVVVPTPTDPATQH